MKLPSILKSVAEGRNWAQNWNYEADKRVSSSRQSGESAGQSDRKELVRLYPSTTGREIARTEEIYGLREEAQARQIVKASASSAGSSPCPSARIAATKSSSLLSCRISRNAASLCFLSFSASESLGLRPLRRSSSMRDDISSSLRPLSIIIRRYSNPFVSSLPIPGLKSTRLTTSAGRRYTGISRWDCSFSLRASCHSTRRSSGLPSGIYELNLTSTGSLLPLCAAPETYEHR
jgi:hypothetical protein